MWSSSIELDTDPIFLGYRELSFEHYNCLILDSHGNSTFFVKFTRVQTRPSRRWFKSIVLKIWICNPVSILAIATRFIPIFCAAIVWIIEVFNLNIIMYLMDSKMLSRAWFRSTDLWVMGPARFHCATLL